MKKKKLAIVSFAVATLAYFGSVVHKLSSLPDGIPSPPGTWLPLVYNLERPVDSGWFQPPLKLPEYFVPEMQGSRLSIEDILKDAQSFPYLVKVPTDISKKENIILYVTDDYNQAKPDGPENGWCAPCRFLRKSGLEEAIQEILPTKWRDVGFIKIGQPKESDRPKVLEILPEGIPRIAVYHIEREELIALSEIRYDGIDAIQIKRRMLEQIQGAMDGTFTSFQTIDREKLRNFEYGFNTALDRDHGFSRNDHNAILTYMALFGYQGLRYDPERKEILARINHDRPLEMWFALRYSHDPSGESTNRNTLEDISQSVRSIGRVAARNSRAAEIFGYAAALRDLLRDEPVTKPGHGERKAFLIQQVFQNANGCIPPYIAPQFEAYVRFAQNNFAGRAGEYHLVEEFTHPHIMEEVQRWAAVNDKKVVLHRLPTDTELSDILSQLVDKEGTIQAMPESDIVSMAESLHLLKDAYLKLAETVYFADHLIPSPPVVAFLESLDSVVIFRDEYNSNFPEQVLRYTSVSVSGTDDRLRHRERIIQEVIEGRQDKDNIQNAEFFGAFMIMAQSYRSSVNPHNAFFYVPNFVGRMGFTSPPHSSIASLTDPYANSGMGEGMMLFTREPNTSDELHMSGLRIVDAVYPPDEHFYTRITNALDQRLTRVMPPH